MNVTFTYLKSTKNFDVYREVDSKGVMFPDDWKLLSAHPELHKVGSIYIRHNSLGADPTTKADRPERIEVTIRAL
jgi:hypothetical protein